jgi:hypothetical protein
MISKLTLASVVAAGGLLAATLSVSAATMPTLNILKDTATAQSQIEKTHGWHRKCRKGLNGSHKHVPGVGRSQCTTAKCFTNIFGYRQCEYF